MPPRPDLATAIGAALEQQLTNDPTGRQADRDAFKASLEADAKLYGTPAWNALPLMRRHTIEQHALNTRAEQAEQEPQS